MYKYNPLQDQIAGAENAVVKPVQRYGVSVFVDKDPDWVGVDFVIDPADEAGIAIFREFAKQMAEHYKSLQNGR